MSIWGLEVYGPPTLSSMCDHAELEGEFLEAFGSQRPFKGAFASPGLRVSWGRPADWYSSRRGYYKLWSPAGYSGGITQRIPEAPNVAPQGIEAGTTAVLDHIDAHAIPERILKALAAATRIPHALLHANAYLAEAGATTECHFDSQDVVIVQLSGERRWQLWEPTIVNPPEGWHGRELPTWRYPSGWDAPSASGEQPLLDLSLRLGEWLYIPSGWWHRAQTASASISVSLTYPRLLESAVVRGAWDLWEAIATIAKLDGGPTIESGLGNGVDRPIDRAVRLARSRLQHFYQVGSQSVQIDQLLSQWTRELPQRLWGDGTYRLAQEVLGSDGTTLTLRDSVVETQAPLVRLLEGSVEAAITSEQVLGVCECDGVFQAADIIAELQQTDVLAECNPLSGIH